VKSSPAPKPLNAAAEPLAPREPCLAMRLLERWQWLEMWGNPVDAELTLLRLKLLARSPRRTNESTNRRRPNEHRQ
jgi:hypothetical protein